MTEIDILTATASELQSLLSSGATTSEALVGLYLDQMVKHNHFGMRLNAMINIASRDDVVRRARELDQERKANGPRGPLHGIPIVIKDLYCTPSLGLPTTAGAVSFLGATAKDDAAVVQRVLEAGALVLGKANLSELGHFKANLLASGWSATGGQVQCPYVRGGVRHDDLLPIGQTSPSGSSSGSAVAVAAGFCPLSIGDEVEGSLTSPATRNALYTLKPTPGSTPGAGSFNGAPAMCATGILAKSARDLIDGTQVLVGKSFDEQILNKGWAGLRIGVLEDDSWLAPETFIPRDKDFNKTIAANKAALEECLAKIASQGAIVKRNVHLPKPHDILKWTQEGPLGELVMATVRDGLNKFLENFTFPSSPGKTLTIDDVVAMNKSPAWSPIALPPEYSAQDGLEGAMNFEWPPSAPHSHEESLRIVFKGIRAAFADLDVDVVVGHGDMMLMTAATMSGSPLAAVPMGGLEASGQNGRRMGTLVLGEPAKDEVLLRVCKAWNETFPRLREEPRMMRNWDDFVAGTASLW